MEVTLSPACEQLLRVDGLDKFPTHLTSRIALALFSLERDSIRQQLKEDRAITPERLAAFNALHREIYGKYALYQPWLPWKDYRIINRYLCTGSATERGTVTWWASGEYLPVLEDLPAIGIP